MIDSYEDGCAIFMVGGDVHATGRASTIFENALERLSRSLVEVYERGADSRFVPEDLREFRRMAAIVGGAGE